MDFFAQKILQYIGIEGKTKLTKCMSNDYYASQYLQFFTNVLKGTRIIQHFRHEIEKIKNTT